MKLLMAVKSCKHHLDRGDHDVIRKTWGQDVPPGVDLKFFVGEGTKNQWVTIGDEVLTEAPDDYDGLPYKTREILRYSTTNDYDVTFLCDTDTFVIPAKLVASGFEAFDYMGVNGRPLGVTFPYNAVDRWKKSHHIEKCYPWASGGFGYFLSNKAASYIVNEEPNIWAEDLWVGQIMGPLYNEGKITMSADRRLEGICTWHFPQHFHNWSQYHPRFAWMETMYREKR